MFSLCHCLNENVLFCRSTSFIRLRSAVLGLQRTQLPLKCDDHTNLDLELCLDLPTSKQKNSHPWNNPSSRRVLKQPSIYHLTLPIINRCLYSAMRSCLHFGRSLSTIRVNHCDVKGLYSSRTNHNNGQLRGYSHSKKDTINIHHLLEHALKSGELPDTMVESSQSRNRHRKLDRIKRNVVYDDADNVEEKPLTVEKKLLSFMAIWKMDEAVDLLVDTLKTGSTPNSGVILNLLQQLAHLGEVDNILLLHDEFLEGKSITREDKFYALLTEAYCNSGRIEEGIAMLRIIYHKTRNFDDIDPFFSMITIMVIRNFEHHIHLITDFVDDLMESDPPVDKALASLWKCLVLTERFDQADALVEEYENLSKCTPAQVSEITNAPFYITFNKDTVYSWLMQLPYIKKSLKAAVFERLIENKCDENKWQEALDCLREAMMNNEGFVKQSTLTLFFSNFLSQLSVAQVKELEELATCLEEENLNENEPEIYDDKDP